MTRRIPWPAAMLLGLFLALTVDAQTQRLVPRGDLWRWAKGTAEASSPDRTAWRASAFDDGAWATGRLPVFYGEALTGTELTDMQNRYSSVFLRRAFTLDSSADVQSLVLRVKVDDGFIAWINGREVARFGFPTGTSRSPHWPRSPRQSRSISWTTRWPCPRTCSRRVPMSWRSKPST